MRIFISHSSHDAERASGICSVLEGGGHSCFIAPRDIRPGREYAEEIINGISGADILLLMLSEQSNQSPHVLREVERAGSSRIPIIVYKLEEVALTKSMEYFLMTNQWIDGTEDPGYQNVSEAFRNQPDLKASPADKERLDGRPPERVSRKRGGWSGIKITASALILLLAVGGIVFAAYQMGHAANVTADTGDEDRAETVELSLGASVELGAYGGEPVIWRVLHVSEEEEQLILVSDRILTMKAFDAAESGKYNSDGDTDYWSVEIEDKLLESFVRGSNLWCDSNIRSWLNSERENVIYEDQAPTASAMSEKKNGYSNEAGFLHGFTEEERAVLKETQVLTIGNVLMDSWGTETMDRVFLLSQEELEWFGEADIGLYAVPTEYALAQDQTGWYEGYSLSLGVQEYPWLLRDPAADSTSGCRAVGNGNGYRAGESPFDTLDRIEAGVEGFGIRPAVCVDRQALAELIQTRLLSER